MLLSSDRVIRVMGPSEGSLEDTEGLDNFKCQCKRLKEASSSASADQRTLSSIEFYLSLGLPPNPGIGGS